MISFQQNFRRPNQDSDKDFLRQIEFKLTLEGWETNHK